MFFLTSFINNIILNSISSTIANFISGFILAVAGFLIYLFFYWQNRKDKLYFFGINNDKFDTKIYVSRLEIKENGTEGNIDIERGFSGPAINKLEYEAGLLIQKELESKTIALLPKKFRDWLGKKNVILNTLKIPIVISPHRNRESSIKNYINSNLFLLGSSMYNLPSKYYLEKYLPDQAEQYGLYENYCIYDQDQKKCERIIGIRFKNTNDFEDFKPKGRSHERELAIIHKFKDKDTGMTIFLFLGHGSSATFGSVRYLVNKWSELYIKYKHKEFIICLAFRGQRANEANGNSVVEPEVLYNNAI